MKKTALTAALALALTAGISAPAQADSKHKQWIPLETVSQSPTRAQTRSEIDKFAADPVKYVIALLLPAVQA